jgi:hypothetical protein
VRVSLMHLEDQLLHRSRQRQRFIYQAERVSTTEAWLHIAFLRPRLKLDRKKLPPNWHGMNKTIDAGARAFCMRACCGVPSDCGGYSMIVGIRHGLAEPASICPFWAESSSAPIDPAQPDTNIKTE